MKNILYLTGFYLATVALSSCNNKQEIISIDILLAESSLHENKLNAECQSLLLPFEEPGGSMFLPQGRIITPSGSVTYIKPQSFLEKLRGNITKNTSPLMLKEKISKHLADLELKPIENTSPDYIDTTIKNYSLALGFNSKLSPNNSPRYPDVRCFSNVEAIRAYIADSVNTRDKIVIVYEMPLLEKIKITVPVVNTDSLPLPAPVKEKRSHRQATPPPMPRQNYAMNNNYTLEEYFEKIADANIPYAQKEQLKAGILKLFTSSAAEVTLELNGLYACNSYTIKNYLENLSDTYRRITINKTEQDGGKISRIYVTEH